jgi:hypothetical protein
VGLVGDFRQYQQVVAAKAVGAPPAFLVIAVNPSESDVEPRAAFGFVNPDGAAFTLPIRTGLVVDAR